MRGRILVLCALVAALSALLVFPAAGASQRSPYAGLGTWLDIYSPTAPPAREIAAMRHDGVRTLYVQTGNYSQATSVVHAQMLGGLIDAAHAAGIRVVAWYLPALVSPAQDLRRSLAAVRFRSPQGERFDSFALDIEASLVHPASLRTARLLRLSAALRKAVGLRYPLGAIIPSPVGLKRHPTYWPAFPFRGLARYYDVILPMAYFTDAHVHGTRASRRYLAEDVAAIRAHTGDARIPIHLIGGIASTMGSKETTGFMRAVADCRPVGFSLYDFPLTRSSEWTALRARRLPGTQSCR